MASDVNAARAEPAGDLRRVFRSSVVFALGGFAYKGLALVTLPILARLLSPDELGLLDLAAVLGSVLALVAMLGLDDAVARHEEEAAAATWSAALFILAATSAALTGTGLLALALLPAELGVAGSRTALSAGVVYGGALAFLTLSLNAIRLRGSPARYSVAAFLTVTLQMLSALALAWVSADPVPLILISWAAIAVVASGFGFSRYLPRIRRPSPRHAERLMRYGIPLVPAAIAWTIGDAGIRAILAGSAGLATVGAYGIASRVVNVLALWIVGFALAWNPFLYRSEEPAVIDLGRRAGPRLLAGLGVTAIALAGLAPEIVIVVGGDDYAEAAAAVPLLAAAMVGFGVFTMGTALVAFKRRTPLVAVATSGASVLQVVAATQLVPSLGIVGASLASAVGYAAGAVCLAVVGGEVTLGLRRRATVAMSVIVAGALAALTMAVDTSLLLRGTISTVAVGSLAAIILASRLRAK